MKRLALFFLLISYSISVMGGEVAKVDSGGGRYIFSPVPRGFVALGSQSPGFRSFSEEAESPHSVLLEIFLTRDDMESVLSGSSPSRRRELKIESFRSVYGRDLSIEDFDRSVAKIRMSPESISYPEREMNEFISRQPGHYAGDPPRASETKQFGKFLDEPSGVGITTCAVVTDSRHAEKHCVSQVILFVMRRAIVLSVVATVHNRSDIEWTVSTAKSWFAEIIAANNG